MPIPAIIRHDTMPARGFCKAIATVATVYHSNERGENQIAARNVRRISKKQSPTRSPANVAATKLASPLNPKNDAEVLVKSPLRTSPGPT